MDRRLRGHAGWRSRRGSRCRCGSSSTLRRNVDARVARRYPDETFTFKDVRYPGAPDYLTVGGPLPSGTRFQCQLSNKSWTTSARVGSNTTRYTTYFVQSISVEIRFTPGRFPQLGGQVTVTNSNGVLGLSGEAKGLSAVAADWIASLNAEIDPTPVRATVAAGQELQPSPAR